MTDKVNQDYRDERRNVRDAMPSACPVCSPPQASITLFRTINGVAYFDCLNCGSLFADFEAIGKQDNAKVAYDEKYWEMEVKAARSRSFGSSLARCAEVFLYSRIPVTHFLDIGTGPGFFLDAVSTLMPAHKALFFGVELYPPPLAHRTSNSNYIVGDVSAVNVRVSAGMCIEVIEHMLPGQLDSMLQNLAKISESGAIFLFNSGQPDYVKNEDPDYLDPFERGHIVSYSIKGITPIFAKHGFSVIPLPGRSWAFLAEKAPDDALTAEDLMNRIWQALPENVDKLKTNGFGELMYSVGLDSARSYLATAIADEKAQWALSLQQKLQAIQVIAQ